MSPASYRRPWETWLIAHLKEYWFLYAAIIQIVYTFWFVQFTLTDHTEKILALQIEQKDHNIVAQDIQTRLASIETSLKYIEQMVKK